MSRELASLRAHRASSEEEDEEGYSSSASSIKPRDSDAHFSSDPLDESEGEERDHDVEQIESDIQDDLQNISFGALAQAQAELALSHPQKSHVQTNHDRQDGTDVEKINLLRERLAELKKLKSSPSKDGHKTTSGKQASSSTKSKSTNPSTRTSKHAPMEQSSRHAVTRRRQVIETAPGVPKSRDPRFSAALSSNQPNAEATKRNYAFLKSYRDAELLELKDAMAGIKARKNKRKSKALTADEENEVERLKRKINSTENKIKSEAEKERLKDVAKRHKNEERELIKQGKKPFYLKRSELKERALKEKFEGMKSKDREKAVERRRKKLSHRERRAMPNQRRVVNE